MRARWSTWFYRLTAVHFIVTSATGLALYFRPGGGRPGWYSEAVKECLVMIHNGEWISAVILGRPFWSGAIIGGVLAWALSRFAWRGLRKSLSASTAKTERNRVSASEFPARLRQ